jgi:large subunit ribosomal protein L15
MLQLNTLPSLCKKRKRIGRGGSRGGTAGRGHKGQKARTGAKGKLRAAFEGGQTPLTRRLPKRGFSNARFAVRYEIVNLDMLDHFFDNGTVVDKKLLIEQGLISPLSAVKILGRGTLTKKLTVHADAFSKSAQERIEHKGGAIVLNKENAA